MKKINQDATRVFKLLLRKLGQKESVKITIGTRDPLIIQDLGTVQTPRGIARKYSFKQVEEFDDCPGAYWRDPEMIFLVLPFKILGFIRTSEISVFPAHYIHDDIGMNRHVDVPSILFRDDLIVAVIPKTQLEQVAAANLWLEYLGKAGFAQ